MKELKLCCDCRYYRNGTCYVIMWANGRKVMMGSVPENGHCDLWEDGEIATGGTIYVSGEIFDRDTAVEIAKVVKQGIAKEAEIKLKNQRKDVV